MLCSCATLNTETGEGGGCKGAHRGATKCLGTGRDGAGSEERVVDFLWTRQQWGGGKEIFICVCGYMRSCWLKGEGRSGL